MFHGVPIVSMPFMLEQRSNGQRAATRGFGIVSPEAPALRARGAHYTRGGVAALVRQVRAPRAPA
jgi:UDP:flavonoid glycosyltransferase YjiC (YdhE family)